MTTLPDLLWPSVLTAIPGDAQRILDLGLNLTEALERLGPQAPALKLAPGWQVHAPDDLQALQQGYDTVLLGPWLGQGHDPAALLALLHERCAPGARLVCALPNACHHSVIERFLMGDLAVDEGGLLPPQAGRLHAPASTMKLLLDGGWLPALHDHASTELSENVPTARLLGTQVALGLQREAATRLLGMAWMVLQAQRLDSTVQPAGPFVPFSVIVPVRHAARFELNAARSPGLAEVQADIVAVPAGSSAAEAWALGAAQARHPWRLMLSEDSYLPAGSGLALAQHLARLQASGHTHSPVGLAGLHAELDLRTGLRHAGQWADGLSHTSGAATQQAVALHDGAVALHADAPLQPEAELGWHLWATDLCLQAIKRSGGESGGCIAQVPAWLAPVDTAHPQVHASVSLLLSRHPEWHRIPTLLGELQRA